MFMMHVTLLNQRVLLGTCTTRRVEIRTAKTTHCFKLASILHVQDYCLHWLRQLYDLNRCPRCYHEGYIQPDRRPTGAQKHAFGCTTRQCKKHIQKILVEWGSNRKYTCNHTRKMVVLNHKATRSKQETFRAAFPLYSLPRVISVHPVNVPHPSVATCLLAKMSYAVEIQEFVRQRKQTLLVSTKIPWL